MFSTGLPAMCLLTNQSICLWRRAKTRARAPSPPGPAVGPSEDCWFFQVNKSFELSLSQEDQACSLQREQPDTPSRCCLVGQRSSSVGRAGC